MDRENMFATMGLMTVQLKQLVMNFIQILLLSRLIKAKNVKEINRISGSIKSNVLEEKIDLLIAPLQS